jgi:outer membrane murein-binding lipoprotein Lpp
MHTPHLPVDVALSTLSSLTTSVARQKITTISHGESEMSLLCPHCSSQNPPGQKFCGECGHSLQNPVPDSETLAAFDARIQAAIDRRLQDQSIVEIKTAQAIVTRVTDWAKLFALITAVPLAILLATLAIWGVTSFLDFRKKVDSGKEQITADIQSARDDIKKTHNDTESLKNEVNAARTELGALPNDVKTLQSKVSRLEEKIGFVPSASLTPQLKSKLQAALNGFQAYCRSVGFHPQPGEVRLRIEENLEKDKGTAAYYDSSNSQMIVDAARASDPSFALREYMHRTLYQKVGLTGTSNHSTDWYGIESGLASYLPASFQNTPQAAFYDLTQVVQLPAQRSDTGSMTELGVQVWGSAFWELRSTMGREACDKLLVRFWNSLDPDAKGPYSAYAVSQIMKLYADSGGKDTATVRAIFSRRGIS